MNESDLQSALNSAWNSVGTPEMIWVSDEMLGAFREILPSECRQLKARLAWYAACKEAERQLQ